MNRVTRKDLDNVVARINRMAGDPVHPYRISGAYGGWSLRRSVEGGGEVDPLRSGYVPVRVFPGRAHVENRGLVFEQQELLRCQFHAG